MKHPRPFIWKSLVRSFGGRHAGGFSLVISLSLMVLLTLLAVGLLSLSTISLRTSARDDLLGTARANARLSLMLAIGQLQEELGPDCRISAPASIQDRDAATPDADQVAHPLYLGAWDSWDTWLTDRKTLSKGGSIALQDTYNVGRHDELFRRWLVSHPEPDATAQRQAAVDRSASLPTVEIVGKGSVGSAPEGIVNVPLVPFSKEQPGAIAWWTADESLKARMDLEERGSDADWQLAQVNSSAAGRTGIEMLDGVSALETDPSVIGKLLDEPTLVAALGEKADPTKPRHFHNLGGHSLGLLANVRSGGMKGDLNLLFEHDQIPTEFNKANLFGSRQFDAPIRPMVGELAKIKPQNPYVAPVSWRQLREYYRLYRNFGGTDSVGRALQWNGGTPSTRRYLVGRKSHAHILDIPDAAGYARQPVLLKQTWIIATRAEPAAAGGTPGTYDYYLVGVPVFHLWNPYNVPMTIGSREMSVVGGIDLATTLRYRLYRGTQMVADQPFSLSAEGSPFGYSLYQVRPTESGGSDMVFQPGEVRVFTVESGVGAGTKEFEAIPGYRPLADTSAVRGLQLKLSALAGTGSGRPSVALGFANDPVRRNDNYWWGNSPSGVTVGMYQMNSAGFGVVDESGRLVTGSGSHEATVYGAYSIDWLTAAEKQAWIVPDSAATRAEWNLGSTRPQPVAIISLTAKGAETFDFDDSASSYAGDFRNRTWLHAPPTRLSHYLVNPGPLARASSAYQVYFRAVNGDQETSQYVQVDGKRGYYGGGSNPGHGQTHVPVYELPTAPATSLAAFAGMRVDHARALVMQHQDSGVTPGGSPYPMYNLKHIAHGGGDFGAGLSNSHAHPMIPGNRVYMRNPLGTDQGHPDGGFQGTNLGAFDDYWDHLFLANEGLWDSWFMSSLTAESTRGRLGKNLSMVARSVFDGSAKLPHRNLQPYLGADSPADVAGSLTGRDGWRNLAPHLTVKGAFNVNSTSVEAWTAQLMGLRHRQVPTLDATTLRSGMVDGGDRVLLSRFRLANGSEEGTGAGDEMSWRGIRFLSDEQIEKLAREIVRQVKLRGPFLNLSEFVNRRLSTGELGVTGALQAAIDADEFEAGYNGSGSSSADSINGAFKGGDDMISTLVASYPNPLAARGSRFAGAPGYVMQSDLLQGLGSSLTVRGDTFLVRGYGDARDSADKVVARAWCEAVIQRLPEYLDPTNSPQTPVRLANGNVNTQLAELNRRFGRRLKVTSFRWLSSEEI